MFPTRDCDPMSECEESSAKLALPARPTIRLAVAEDEAMPQTLAKAALDFLLASVSGAGDYFLHYLEQRVPLLHWQSILASEFEWLHSETSGLCSHTAIVQIADHR